jgi:hypothetical protein
MKIYKIQVENYRLLKNFSIDLEDELSFDEQAASKPIEAIPTVARVNNFIFFISISPQKCCQLSFYFKFGSWL